MFLFYFDHGSRRSGQNSHLVLRSSQHVTVYSVRLSRLCCAHQDIAIVLTLPRPHELQFLVMKLVDFFLSSSSSLIASNSFRQDLLEPRIKPNQLTKLLKTDTCHDFGTFFFSY